jgi:hypothetical protein
VRCGLTWNQVAGEAGVNVGTIRRLRANGRFETDGILSLTQWLGRPVEEFTRRNTPAPPPSVSEPSNT